MSKRNYYGSTLRPAGKMAAEQVNGGRKMSKRNYLAFDIEITKIVEGTDWLSQRPLGISVACTLERRADEEELRYWFGEGHPDGCPWDKMPQLQVQTLVHFLEAKIYEGLTPLTWNGLHFDLNILAEESGMVDECRDLAMDMVDPMFHFYWVHGYPVGLQAVTSAMLGKSKTGTGAEAPLKWAMGLYDEVMEYCANDVRILLDVVLQIESRGRMEWFSRAGKLMEWEIPGGRLLTVREVLALPARVDPWIPVEDFTRWLRRWP